MMLTELADGSDVFVLYSVNRDGDRINEVNNKIKTLENPIKELSKDI